MRKIYAKQGFEIKKSVVMRPIDQDVMKATDYDPDHPLKNIAMDTYDQNTLDQKEALAKRAELLESRLNGTTSGTMTRSEREQTLLVRYDKLLAIIEDYKKSDPVVQAYLANQLNRAIDAINREFSPVDRVVAKDMEKKIVDAIKDVHAMSDKAHDEILAIFAKYKALDPATAAVVLYDVQRLYKAYMKSTSDTSEKKSKVSKAFYSLPRKAAGQISFDIQYLYDEQAKAEVPEELGDKIDMSDATTMKYDDLTAVVKMFNELDIANKASTYCMVANLIDEYCDEHPKSIAAENMRKGFSENYYELVRREHHYDIVDSCRLMNATTTAYSRNANVSLAKDMLASFNKLSGKERDVIRPVVIEAIERFNNFELKRVVAPVLREEEDGSENEGSKESKYSYEFEAVINDLENDDKNDYSETIKTALGLDVKEQMILVNRRAVKENDLVLLALTNHLADYKFVTSKESGVDAKPLVDAFVRLSVNTQHKAFGSFMKKYVQSSYNLDNVCITDEIKALIVDSFIAYSEDFDEHNTTDFLLALNFAKRVPEALCLSLREHMIAYYESFSYNFPHLAGKIAKSMKEYVEANGNEQDKKRVADIADGASKEASYNRVVGDVKALTDNVDAVDKEKLTLILKKYKTLNFKDQVDLYVPVLGCVDKVGSMREELDTITADESFEPQRLLRDILHADANKLDAAGMLDLMRRTADCKTNGGYSVSAALFVLYEKFVKKHPRFTASDEFADVFDTLCNNCHRFASSVAAAFASDMIIPMVLKGIDAGDLGKTITAFNNLPLSVRADGLYSMYDLYQEYKNSRPNVSPKLQASYNAMLEQFASDAVAAGGCRQEFVCVALKIIRADKTLENWNAFIKNGSMKTVENGGYIKSLSHNYEKALFNICFRIDNELQAKAHEKALMKQFETELSAFRSGLDMRSELATAREISQLVHLIDYMKEMGVNASVYAANAYVVKIAKFMASSVSSHRFHIVVTDNDQKQSYEIERIVTPCCVIAKDGEEKVIIATDVPLGIDVSRDEPEIYTALTGRTVVKANEALNEQMRFRFDADSKPVMVIREPISTLSDYEPSESVVEYPVKAIIPDGLRSVIVVEDLETREIIEIVSGIKPTEIMSRVRSDVVIDDEDRVLIANGHKTIVEHASAAVAYQKNVMKSLIVLSAHQEISDTVEKINGDQAVVFKVRDGRFECVLDKAYPIVALKQYSADESLVVMKDTDGKQKALVCKGLCSEIIDNAFAEAIAEADYVIDHEASIVAFGSDVCLKQMKNGFPVVAPIYDIRNSDNGAIVDLITVMGNRSVEIGLPYEDALRIFAMRYRESAYCPKCEATDIRFLKENGCVKGVCNGKDDCDKYEVISIHEHVEQGEVYAVNESGFIRIVTDNIVLAIKKGLGIVSLTTVAGRDEIKVGTGDACVDAISTVLPAVEAVTDESMLDGVTEEFGVSLNELRVIPEGNDLSRVAIVTKKGERLLRGVNKDRAQVVFDSFEIKHNELGEMLVVVPAKKDGEQDAEYRVISAAFGEYAELAGEAAE